MLLCATLLYGQTFVPLEDNMRFILKPVTPYRKLQRYWDDTGSEISRQIAQKTAVLKLETRYDVRLPKDFREYLIRSSPTEGENWDVRGTYWWSVDRIKNIPDEFPHKIDCPVIENDARRYLFFADHLVWCAAWAIDCGRDGNRGRIAFIGGASDKFVAPSFASFVDRCVADFDSVSY